MRPGKPAGLSTLAVVAGRHLSNRAGLCLRRKAVVVRICISREGALAVQGREPAAAAPRPPLPLVNVRCPAITPETDTVNEYAAIYDPVRPPTVQEPQTSVPFALIDPSACVTAVCVSVATPVTPPAEVKEKTWRSKLSPPAVRMWVLLVCTNV